MLSERVGNREHILIPTAAHIHDDEGIFAELFREINCTRDSVARLQRWEDAFEPCAELEGFERFSICG